MRPSGVCYTLQSTTCHLSCLASQPPCASRHDKPCCTSREAACWPNLAALHEKPHAGQVLASNTRKIQLSNSTSMHWSRCGNCRAPRGCTAPRVAAGVQRTTSLLAGEANFRSRHALARRRGVDETRCRLAPRVLTPSSRTSASSSTCLGFGSGSCRGPRAAAGPWPLTCRGMADGEFS